MSINLLSRALERLTLRVVQGKYFLSDGAKESDLQDLMTELTILKEVNKIPHPNVIKFMGGCSIDGKLFIE